MLFRRRETKILEELEREKRRLTIEKETIQLELDQVKKRTDLDIELEKKRFEEEKKHWKKDGEIKVTEAISLAKIESKSKISALETHHAQEISKIQQEESKKFYDKLQDAFRQMSLEGDKNSKFVQELAIKVFENAKDIMPKSNINVDIQQKELKGK